MGRYTQGLRLRAMTAELEISRARWRWFGVGFGGGLVAAGVFVIVRWLTI
jgi:hypothetical protein